MVQSRISAPVMYPLQALHCSRRLFWPSKFLTNRMPSNWYARYGSLAKMAVGWNQTDTDALFLEYFSTPFDSWDDFASKLNAYQERTHAVFKPKNCTTVAYENKSRKEPIPEKFKYSVAKFICRHYGQPVKKGLGIRKIQRYLALGCPAYLTVSYSRGALRLTKWNACHENHTLESEAKKFHPQKRRRLHSDEEKVQGAIQMQPSNHELKFLIDKVENVQSCRKKNRILSSSLFDTVANIQKQGAVRLDVLDDNTLNVLSFCTNQQIALCRKFPEILFIDGIYRVNKHDHPLIQILAQDNLGNVKTVFFSFVWEETDKNIKKILQHFLEIVGPSVKDSVSTVFVDEAQNFTNQAKEIFPNAKVLLCKYRVITTFQEKVSKMVVPTFVKENIMTSFLHILNACDEVTFRSSVNKLKEVSDDIFNYFVHDWLPVKEMWAMHLRKDLIDFGNNTYNRTDSGSGYIDKKAILSQSDTLVKCVENLIANNGSVNDETPYGQSDSKLSSLYNLFTESAVKYMKKNHSGIENCSAHLLDDSINVSVQGKSHTVSSSGKCTCLFNKQYGLPCIHAAFSWLYDFVDLQALVNGNQWLTSSSLLPDLSSKSTAQVISSSHPQPLTAAQRKKAIDEVCQKLNLVLSRCEPEQFERRMMQLEHLIEMWKAGKEVLIILETGQEEVGREVAEMGRSCVVQGGIERGAQVERNCFREEDIDRDTVDVMEKSKEITKRGIDGLLKVNRTSDVEIKRDVEDAEYSDEDETMPMVFEGALKSNDVILS